MILLLRAVYMGWGFSVRGSRGLGWAGLGWGSGMTSPTYLVPWWNNQKAGLIWPPRPLCVPRASTCGLSQGNYISFPEAQDCRSLRQEWLVIFKARPKPGTATLGQSSPRPAWVREPENLQPSLICCWGSLGTLEVAQWPQVICSWAPVPASAQWPSPSLTTSTSQMEKLRLRLLMWLPNP